MLPSPGTVLTPTGIHQQISSPAPGVLVLNCQLILWAIRITMEPPILVKHSCLPLLMVQVSNWIILHSEPPLTPLITLPEVVLTPWLLHLPLSPTTALSRSVSNTVLGRILNLQVPLTPQDSHRPSPPGLMVTRPRLLSASRWSFPVVLVAGEESAWCTTLRSTSWTTLTGPSASLLRLTLQPELDQLTLVLVTWCLFLLHLGNLLPPKPQSCRAHRLWPVENTTSYMPPQLLLHSCTQKDTMQLLLGTSLNLHPPTQELLVMARMTTSALTACKVQGLTPISKPQHPA